MRYDFCMPNTCVAEDCLNGARSRGMCAYHYNKAWKKSKTGKQRTAASDRRTYLRTRYGMSPEQVDALLVAQGGCCALCGDPVSFEGGPVKGDSGVIDHNHITGKVRGVLHNRCNIAIGHLLESPARCLLAHSYLTKHE